MPIEKIIAHQVTKTIGGKLVLNNINLSAANAQCIGIVGENGAGKSTLLRLLAGLTTPDSGTVMIPKNIGFLQQTSAYPPTYSLQTVIDDALAEARAAALQLEQLSIAISQGDGDATLFTEYSQCLEWAEYCDLWNADRRAEDVLRGFQLDHIAHTRRVDALSGGQVARLSLAALLIRQPAALLLDEPTNHLDDEAIEFLEAWLKNFRGPLVLASHDRVFLDTICTHIIDLDPGRQGAMHYTGNYSSYLEIKQRERFSWEQQFRAEQKQLKELQQAVSIKARTLSHSKTRKDNNKLSYNSAGERIQKQIARRVQNAQLRLDTLRNNQVKKPPASVKFSAPLTMPFDQSKIILSLKDVHMKDRLLIEEYHILANEKWLILGSNGAGKSSLLHLLAGLATPDNGTAYKAPNLCCKLLKQETRFRNLQLTPRRLYAQYAPSDAPPLQELGLLPSQAWDIPIGKLSLGQQKRLALAMIISKPPHVLLLDEPTNHIALSLVQELEEAFHTSAGAIIIASHDRWLRRRWQGKRLTLEQGKIS
ncbi:ABC-F family ATP-binding cassette domain-containing protein [Bartonella sp. DGB2]|uniref:ABC-F family ATP-binding cassette domain-containing protein n=1 Tax=Bartonella sp. DGB2 TaxID=3388426 RepID=UPI00398FF2CE